MPRRYRVQHKFWLDVTCDIDDHLDEWIGRLKKRRLFTDTLRQGLRLMESLRAHRVDLLCDLFPWIETHFFEKYAAGQGDLAARLAALEAQIAALKVAPAPRPQPVASVPAPADEDDVIVPIKKAASDGFTASNNFLKSCGNLMQ